MDVNMPVMDGITSTQYIMKYCTDKQIDKPNIYALTAYDTIDN